MESSDYAYRRNPNADPMSLEGTQTGYLLRMKLGYETDNRYISKEYYDMICVELKIRGVIKEGDLNGR